MDYDRVIPGVGAGGLTDKYDIKILVCYLLNCLKTPLTKTQLDFVFQDGSYANYFSYCAAYAELLASGHITLDGDTLVLHELGVETAKRLYTNLPSSLRDNVVASAMGLLARIKHERENEAHIQPYGNGYRVSCTIHDTDFDLLSFQIYAPDILQAEQIANRFRSDPAKLYQSLIQYLVF